MLEIRKFSMTLFVRKGDFVINVNMVSKWLHYKYTLLNCFFQNCSSFLFLSFDSKYLVCVSISLKIENKIFFGSK